LGCDQLKEDWNMADLPSEQTLAELSWYAQAAIATRCARRAQPLYVTTHQEAREGLERVIVALEAFTQGTGGGYVAQGIFSSTSFPDLPFEMAAAVYTSFGAAQVCSAAGNDDSFDDSTIPQKTARALQVGMRAYERTTFAPGTEARAAAVAKYVAAVLADVAALQVTTGGAAGTLGTPINLASLGSLWSDGPPDWLPRLGPGIITPVDTLVRFDDPQTGPVFINPRPVALIRGTGPGVTEVLLNLGTRTETVVLHLPVERVQSVLLVSDVGQERHVQRRHAN
jgi:hypothetical protein